MATNRGGERPHLFILIDALGWRLAERAAFLTELLPFRAALRTTLGYSSAAIPTLLTGLLPAEHGFWNLLFYAASGAPFSFLRLAPDVALRALDHRAGRRLLTGIGRRWLRLGPHFECCVAPRLLPYLQWGERGDLFAPGGLHPARSIFDDWQAAGLPARVFSYRQGRDADLIAAARQACRDGANPVFLYLSEFDHALHQAGAGPEAALPLARLAADLRGWLEEFIAAGGRVAVFSDHGMMPVGQHCDLSATIAELPLRQPRDYLAVYDSTMARFWVFNERARQRLSAALADLPYGRLLGADELRREGVYFADGRYGQLIFLLHPGWLFGRGDFNGRGWNPVAMHGYHPDHPDSDAFFASNEPPRARLRGLADVYWELRRPLEAAPPLVATPRPAARPLRAGSPRPRNVLYFSSALARGGAEEHLLGLLRGLDRSQFHPYLACPAALARALGEAIPNDVPVVPLRLRGPHHGGAALRLAARLRGWRIDVLHSHLFYASLFATPVGRAAGVAVLVETPHLREEWRKGWKGHFALDRAVSRAVDAHIAVSRANARYLLEVKGLAAEKIFVIENGIDLDRFTAPLPSPAPLRAALGLASRDPVLLVIGRLERQKGHPVLLRALPELRRRFPRLRLICLGEGSQRTALEREAGRLGVTGAVHFAGYQAAIEPWLALADVVVLPSWFEGLPLAALEALAAGRPLVATAVDGTSEIVRHERTGLLAPAGDSAALVAAIQRLLLAPAWAARLAREGRRSVFAHFDRRTQIARTQDLYWDLWRTRTGRALAAGRTA